MAALNLALFDADLRRDEGCRNRLYQDTESEPTIGIGHLCTLNEVTRYAGQTLSDAEIEHLFEADKDYAISQIDRCLPWWREMPEPAQRALANQVFEMGIAGVERFTHMVDALKVANYTGAAKAALDSKWARQVPARAARVAALYRSASALPA